jgi:hypothetical protein
MRGRDRLTKGGMFMSVLGMEGGCPKFSHYLFSLLLWFFPVITVTIIICHGAANR